MGIYLFQSKIVVEISDH